MKKVIEYKGFDAYIIYLCKHHYKSSGNIIDDLKLICLIRCGVPTNNLGDNAILQYIANRLYKILKPTIINNEHFMEIFHDYVGAYFLKSDELELYNKYGSYVAIVKIIKYYTSKIYSLQVKEKVNKNYRTLIKLSKPNKRIINRILQGKGKYEDYYLLKS